MPSVRDVFFTEIYNQVKNGENLYVISADLGAPGLDDFRRDFPDRYISVGIAEQNLIQVAAGMTWGGVKVVAYGLNPFPITRAFDQIRCLMAELKVPFTLCVLNAGLCSSECGYTHMPVEDMAMLRTLSNVEIYNPSDEIISRILAKETVCTKSPRIIRFDKSINGVVYDNEFTIEKGYAVLGCKGKAALGIITNGCYIKELSRICAEKCDNVKLIDLFRIPANEEELCNEIMQCNKLISIEENVRNGGIGSMILELINDRNLNIQIKRLGLDFSNGYYDVFTDRNFIRKAQKIETGHLVSIIEGILGEEVYQL